MTKLVLAISILSMALLSPAAALAAQEPGGSSAEFRTPAGAAYCGYDEVRAHFACWTPNDGFTVWMHKGRAHKTYDPYLRGFAPRAHTLRFGWGRDFASTYCVSRRSGLTCTTRKGHGWWLGRYVGYRLF